MTNDNAMGKKYGILPKTATMNMSMKVTLCTRIVLFICTNMYLKVCFDNVMSKVTVGGWVSVYKE